jgi:uncharacterized protein (TIGR04255 family)
MTERLHYPKAPIIEAVIDLKVELNDGCSFEHLAKIHDIIKDDYPQAETIFTGEVEAKFGNETGAKATQQNVGYKLSHLNTKYILQAHLEGFSLSALHPYDRWESFRDEARRLWNVYRSVANPKQVTRAAVRYINRLDIPFPSDGEELKQENYLYTYPEVSKGYPYSDIENFFMNLVIPQPDIQSVLSLTQARAIASTPQTVSLILDIDLFSARSENPWDAVQDESVWEFFEQLHTRKNIVFEESITEKTKELIR